jgi:tryptophanyl-tRNA synthetase
MKFPNRILSGIQPTGVPHLGNYFGAIRNWVELQDCSTSKIIVSIVDLHAITVPQDPYMLQQNTVEMAQSLLACGIKDDQILFRQSTIPQHSQLAWILFCKTPVGWVNRLHQWKTKSEGLDGHLGLLSYPVLQAADILLYRATQIPVGEDQAQHMNLTTMIAKSFNSHYKTEMFPIPRALYCKSKLILASTASKRLMSLKDPTKKMSKSDPNANSRIMINDAESEIQKKIRKATTDSIQGITYDPINRPGVSNLINIIRSIRNVDVQTEFAHLSNKEFKDRVADELVAYLGPIRQKWVELQRESQYIEQVLARGEQEARQIAESTLKDVHRCIGLP